MEYHKPTLRATAPLVDPTTTLRAHGSCEEGRDEHGMTSRFERKVAGALEGEVERRGALHAHVDEDRVDLERLRHLNGAVRREGHTSTELPSLAGLASRVTMDNPKSGYLCLEAHWLRGTKDRVVNVHRWIAQPLTVCIYCKDVPRLHKRWHLHPKRVTK
jgi:hypothetical protein